MWSKVMVPVGETKMSISDMTVSAHTRSQSANRIRPPEPLRAEAQSSHTDARFPTNLVSVARVMPSLGEGAKMSNSDMTTQTPVKYQQLPRQPAQGRVAPRRQGPRVPFAHWGLWAPSLLCATHAVSRVLLLLAVGSLSLWDASQGVLSQHPLTPGRFWGRRPSCTFHHCTGQVATDPQSPKGGSQRACPPGVPTPRLLGKSKEWRCFSSRPC